MFKSDSISDAGTFFDGNNMATRNAFAAGGQYILSAGMVLNGGLADTDKHIAVIRFSDANTVVYIDGGPAILSGNAGDSPLNGLNFGCNLREQDCKAFKLAEFLLYDKSLEDAEINSIGGHLGEKYGITWTAVSPHVPVAPLTAYVNYNGRHLRIERFVRIKGMLDQSGNEINASIVPSSDFFTLNITDAEFNNQPSFTLGTGSRMVSTFFPRPQDQAQPNTYFLAYVSQNHNDGTYFDGVATLKNNRLSTVNSVGGSRGVYSIFAGTEALSTAQAELQAHITMVRFNTTTSSLYIDGGTPVISNADVGTQDMQAITIGTKFDTTDPKFFKFAAFRMYNRAITDAEANTIGGQLAIIYGTTWTDI